MSKNAKKTSKGETGIIDADFKQKVEQYIADFIHNENLDVMEFPESLTNVHRAYVHKYVQKLGLKSKSYGDGNDRKLRVYKPTDNSKVSALAPFRISEESEQLVFKLLDRFPISKEDEDLLEAGNSTKIQEISKFRINVAPLSQTKYIHVPPIKVNKKLLQMRRNLPIYQYRQQVIDSIAENKVLLVVAETGSGKTTQVPQYIMEEAARQNNSCRIICAQPRRISAVSVADRVAFERDESVGTTVGYQIRLESNLSPNSNLIYCTNGVILRCLMGGDLKDFFGSITHIIIDEVHERDKYTDFLLISIKEYMHVNPNLRVIIMSATIDTDSFVKYFNDCAVMKIPGKLFDVQVHYLDEVLKLTNFTNKKVEIMKEKFRQNQQDSLRQHANRNQSVLESMDQKKLLDRIDDETRQLLNDTMEHICQDEDPQEAMDQFFYLIESENLPIDVRNETTGMTVLMIVAGLGLIDLVDKLLKLGANPKLSVIYGSEEMCAYDLAVKFGKTEVAELILSNIRQLAESEACNSQEQDDTRLYNKLLLDIYYESRTQATWSRFSVADDDLDYDLICKLIQQIHLSNIENRNAILVFLPGYEDIIQVFNQLNANLGNSRDYKVFLLHSKMQTQDQKMVFKPTDFGQRKIILSTNIAETSITIEEVVFVIDCGREKQVNFDSLSHSSSLRLTWISKSSSKQRAGRAGRVQNGFCYRIYSEDRFNHMPDYTVPEILRIPLTEISLQAKLLASKDMNIEEFLLKAVTPPPQINIKQSIKLLKNLEALDENENLTQLGVILADLPVDVRLGKMLVYSIIFKCVDPVLTIVSTLSIQDPFILPIRPEDRVKSNQLKRAIAENSFSDHYVLLKIFQNWNEFKSEKSYDAAFCAANYINGGLMERIFAARVQIIGQMRSVGIVSQKNLHHLNENSGKWFVVKACLAAGLYPNVVKIDKNKSILKSQVDSKILTHVSSVLREKSMDKMQSIFKVYPSEYIVFEEKVRTNNMNQCKYNTLVHPADLILTAGKYKLERTSEVDTDETLDQDQACSISIDEFVRFSTNVKCGFMLEKLRKKLDALILKFLRAPRDFKAEDENEKFTIEAVVKFLENEEKAAGFHLNFPKIGARPRGLTLKYSNNSSTSNNYGYDDGNCGRNSSDWRRNGGGGAKAMGGTGKTSNNRQQHRNQYQNSTNNNDRKTPELVRNYETWRNSNQQSTSDWKNDNAKKQQQQLPKKQNSNKPAGSQANYQNQPPLFNARHQQERYGPDNFNQASFNPVQTPNLFPTQNANFYPTLPVSVVQQNPISQKTTFYPNRQRNDSIKYFVIVLHDSRLIHRLAIEGEILVKNIDALLQNDAFSQYAAYKNFYLFFMSREDCTLYASGKLMFIQSILHCKFFKNICVNLNEQGTNPFVASLMREVYDFNRKWAEIPELLGQDLLSY